MSNTRRKTLQSFVFSENVYNEKSLYTFEPADEELYSGFGENRPTE